MSTLKERGKLIAEMYASVGRMNDAIVAVDVPAYQREVAEQVRLRGEIAQTPAAR